jgi:hypothetical protein
MSLNLQVCHWPRQGCGRRWLHHATSVVQYSIKTANPHLMQACRRSACCGPGWPIYAGALVDRACARRAAGTRPGGWVGRGPAWMGGMVRLTGPSTDRRIS